MISLPHLGSAYLISDDENLDLIRLPDLDEVKQALFNIDSSKTLGPDGFGVGFFKHYLNIIKTDLLNCVLDFIKNGKLIKKSIIPSLR